MNKKIKMVIGVCVALVLLILVGLFASGTTEQTMTKMETENVTSQSTVENNNNEIAPVTTNPKLDKDVTEAVDGEQIKEKENTTNPTIPDENVQMGTVKGNDDGRLNDVVNDSTTSSESRPSESIKPAEDSKPADTTQPATPENVLGADFDIRKLTYEEFIAMSGDQQRAVISIFGTPEDFMVWYSAVEEAYKSEHPDIEIGGDGVVDLG